MRLDKYLKVTRIIKRRTVANNACDAAHVTVNDRPAKASYDVKVGDIIAITFGRKGNGRQGFSRHLIPGVGITEPVCA